MQLIISATQQVNQSSADALNIVSATELSPNRNALETFIANGFATAFDARIHHFLPLLVGIQTNGLRSALGIRSAQHALFVEQYLDSDLETTLKAHGLTIKRSKVAEIGNLYSASSRYTLPLLLAVSTALYVNQVEYAVFTATQPLIDLFKNNSLPLIELAEANPSKLAPSIDEWGSYYSSKPKVMVLALRDVIRLMLSQPALFEMYTRISQQMPVFSQQVRCL